MSVIYDETQHKLLKHVFPPKDLAVVQKRKYLLRMAVIISASYAYYRQLLPPEAFKRKLLYHHEIHLFNSDHPVGSKEKKAFTNLEGPVCNGEIREIYFAACEEPNARTVVEALKFEFSYNQNTMVAQFPNSTHIRVGDITNFAIDFETMIYRVRTVCSLLKDFGRTMVAGVMCTFTSRRASIDPITGYNIENFEDVTKNLESIPIGYIPLLEEDGAMGVQLMTRYFEESPEDVFKDVELQVQYQDRWPTSSALTSNDEGAIQSPNNNNGDTRVFSRTHTTAQIDGNESTILGGHLSSVEKSRYSDSIIMLEHEEGEEHARTADEYLDNFGNLDSPLPPDSLLDDDKGHLSDSSLPLEKSTSSRSGDSDDGHNGGAEMIQKEQTVLANEQTVELTSIRKRFYTPFEELPLKKSKPMNYVLMESEKVSGLTINMNENGQVICY